MAVNFPNSPVNGTTHTEGGLTWVYNNPPGVWQKITPEIQKVNNKNILYNGEMLVAQRGTSSTGVTTENYYTCDRWIFALNNLGTWTINQTADGPADKGFSRCFEAICTTADASPIATDFATIQQRIEGRDVQRLAKGKSGAKSLTLSFSVKSNVTGTYIAEIFDLDNSRHIGRSYTINSANTWETKILTVPGDTTGVFNSDNDQSFFVGFWVAGGSNYTGGTLNTAWNANVDANRAAGQLNLAAATSNYFRLTGVQLEEGTVVSEYDHHPYSVELARCQRYYEVTRFNLATTSFGGGIAINQKAWAVEKRATPTLTLTPDTGTGGTVTTDGATLFYQNAVHSVVSGATVTGSAEI